MPLLARHPLAKLCVSTAVAAVVAALLLGAAPLSRAESAPPPAKAAEPPLRQLAWRHPKSESWPETVEAKGYIMPWQELRIATEIGGLRLASVTAGIGDRVRKGQILARLETATIETDIDSATGQLAEAEATLAQAVATVERARRLAPSGGVSQQELTLYETQRHTAEARVRVARAQEKRQQLRLQNATIVAPDDGLISAAGAAEGAIVPAGSELFRLIRQGRLEWRAEVRGELLVRLAKGQEVTIERSGAADVPGKIRLVSPTIDLGTHNGLAYIDLPADTNLKAGLNVSGRITVARRKVLTVPDSLLIRRNDAARLLLIDADDKLRVIEVSVGQSRNGWSEVSGNLDEHSRLALDSGDDFRNGETVLPLAEQR